MKKFLFGILIFLLAPVFAFASYDRTPSNYYLYNPVSFHLTDIQTDYRAFIDDCLSSPPSGNTPQLYLQLDAENTGLWLSPFFSSTTDEINFSTPDFHNFDNNEFGLPADGYTSVNLYCGDGSTGYLNELETGGFPFIFEILESAPQTIVGTIITLGSNFASNTLAYAGQLFTDLNGLVYLAIGLPVGFWIIKKVISLVSSRAK